MTATTAAVPVTPDTVRGARKAMRQLVRMPTAGAGLIILILFCGLALAAPLFIHPSDLDVTAATGPQLAPPSAAYPLGTDQDGRSVLLLTIWGARPSLVVGLSATVLTLVLGTAVGLLAGHYQGWFGRGLMMVTDWFIALPQLPFAIALSSQLSNGDLSVIIAIALTSWTMTARLVRAQTLAVEARPFIERAKVLGAGNVQIMVRHVLPNVAPLILVSATLTVASAILTATTLTFLGLGNPTEVSWGGMLFVAFRQGAVSAGAWWYLIPPGVAILIVVLGFTMIGRAVEAVLNPRMGRDR